jgi:uncharacterized protein (TIGR02452 family)
MFTKDSRRGDKFKKVARHFNVMLPTPRHTDDNKGNGRRINRQVADETCEILQKCTYVYNDKIININLVEGETFDAKALALIKKGIISSASTSTGASASTSTSTSTSDNSSQSNGTSTGTAASAGAGSSSSSSSMDGQTLKKTKFIVVKATTVDAIHRFYLGTENDPEDTLTVLNFASAKNPGGGFLKGSEAQEESLARATGLFATIRSSPMYEANEKDNRKCLYQEYIIYSPNVPVFRDSEDELIEEPIYINIVSVPAVNQGEALKKGVSKTVIDNTRYDRMENFLAVLKSRNVKRIILGAWGCGVFGGQLRDVATDYYAHLVEGKYKDVFEEVIFAVLEEDDVKLLEEYFLD